MAKTGIKGNKHKHSGRNNGPARQRYWSGDKLELHKVKHLMIFNKLTRGEATRLWRTARTTRMKTR